MSVRVTLRKLTHRVNGGLAGLAARIRSAGRADLRVKVGLPTGSSPYPDGTSVIMVGIEQEFGSENGRIPERSFLRSTMRRKAPEHRRLIQQLARSVHRGDRDPEDALALLGMTAADNVQQTIQDGVPPPNAPSTVRRKGSSHTLIDTGHLIQSITYQRVRRGERLDGDGGS